eukprot:GHUV01014456.1.p1 GENE.GHUV01014456.1~~GHUV01014456.1.p1  ORF type:complete len:291 (-),score=72.36 GHUV01014456.1:1073-1945(-)
MVYVMVNPRNLLLLVVVLSYSMVSRVAGTSCSAYGLSGTCKATAACTAEGGGSVAGFCPGAADIQCCLHKNCSGSSQSGVCKSTKVSGQCSSGNFLTGACPGPDAFRCCISGSGGSSGGSGRPCSSVQPTREGLKAAVVGIANSRQRITYTQSTQRWSGINNHVCYPNIPPTADCSSFVTWVYWMAFGNKADDLNKQNWKAGYTGTLASNGVKVSVASAQPGDLVFYALTGSGRISHVAMFVGSVNGRSNMVVSYGSNGPAYFLPYDYVFHSSEGTAKFHSIRSYPSFFK